MLYKTIYFLTMCQPLTGHKLCWGGIGSPCCHECGKPVRPAGDSESDRSVVRHKLNNKVKKLKERLQLQESSTHVSVFPPLWELLMYHMDASTPDLKNKTARAVGLQWTSYTGVKRAYAMVACARWAHKAKLMSRLMGSIAVGAHILLWAPCCDNTAVI